MSVSQLVMVCWAALVVLSVGTVMLGAPGLWEAVLVLAVAKAWVIADGFMELRHAPGLWRGLLLGWPVVLVGVIAVTRF
ncbi:MULTISPECIES: cytochrome C oxidase subunit IV family protein [unclassified Pseudomonas]|uniref:cytochrome C oxidase subunit IV family protein n=1 Tax=unclassified Pseudomonas TaxID=196821 RepID=UPI0011ED6464|nr:MULTISPECIES: cytochrome C oxidase subunit IV family protein [unclassified Pseudomonas]KAA0944790.1 hypothetical protein FQ182_20365 [Pseudomonas sp. ANT_H4]KAA0952620.1 hypothetical protein FQ186_09755 [Pseudomonas sp. ANT_H14]